MESTELQESHNEKSLIEKNKNSIRATIIEREKDEVKIRDLLEAVYHKYGYDFRQYSEAHVKRRILNRMNLSGIEDISELQTKVLNERSFASTLLKDLSINVTEMFRDPGFYRSF